MNVLEVFADVVCPFTHVGLRRLVEHRAKVERHDVVLRVRAWPLELVNGAPLDRGLVAAEVDALRAEVAPDLFEGFDASRFPATSRPAMALTAAGYARGLEAGERVALHLRSALFEEGRDIADLDVLRDIAAASDIDVRDVGCGDEVEADWEEGRRRGVIGSPHFFLGQRSWFCPTLDISHVDGELKIRRDDDGIRSFLDACFDR